jgi:hypothetical protein
MFLPRYFVAISFFALSLVSHGQLATRRVSTNEIKKGFINSKVVLYEIRSQSNGKLYDTISTKTIEFRSDSVFIMWEGKKEAGEWMKDGFSFYVINSNGKRIVYEGRFGSTGHFCFAVDHNTSQIECYRKLK